MKRDVKCNHCNEKIRRYKTKTDTYFCNIICKGKWQISQREKKGYTKEWLIKQYHDLGKSANQIAREIKKDPKRVWEWIKNYKIETRERGSYSNNHFKKGHKGSVGRKHSDKTKNKIRQACLKDGRVPYLKNGIHWLHETKRHPASWKGGITPERQALYSSKEWSNIVLNIWKRDKATCRNCNKSQNDNRDNKFHIHHIISFQNIKYRKEISNLVLLCPKCHRFIHSKKNINNKYIKHEN